MYNVSPDGADSSIKIDVTASKLGCLATPLRVVNRSDGAGGSPAEAIIRLLFGDICDRAGPFLKFEKNRHMASRKPRFGFSSVSP